MDNGDCGIPAAGTQDTFGCALKQIITGVKEHGYGMHLFPALETLHKGANLTIAIIDEVIAGWKDRHGYYPTVIYLQVDGGSENANQYVLYHLEHLVSKRIAETIYYTRLPTGHTHDDVDGAFGVVKLYCTRYRVIDTFDDFKAGVEKSFKKATGLQCFVHDLKLVVADYQALYRNSKDPELSDLHRLEATQLAFRFDAVIKQPLFPLGVRTMYKAFSSDKVIVFEKKTPAECLTPIGMATGLEPYCTLTDVWRPSVDDDPNRVGVEGFYLMRSMPSWAVGSLPPQAFSESSSARIAENVQKIISNFSNSVDDSEVVHETIAYRTWIRFKSTICPDGEQTAQQYVDMLQSRLQKNPLKNIPMQQLLFNEHLFVTSPQWGTELNLNSKIIVRPIDYNAYISWPSLMCAATHSIRTSMNLHPMPYRVFSPTDQRIVQSRIQHGAETAPYYHGLQHLTKPKLVGLLASKVGFDGQEVQSGAASLNKSALIEKIKKRDLEFFTLLIRNIDETQKFLVTSKFGPSVYQYDGQGDEAVAAIDGNPVSLSCFRELKSGFGISVELVKHLCALLNQRARTIFIHYCDVNAGSANYFPPKLDKFFVLTQPVFSENDGELVGGLSTIDPVDASLGRLFLLYQSPANHWACAEINLIEKSVMLIVPHNILPALNADNQVVYSTMIFNKLKERILSSLINGFDETGWTCAMAPFFFGQPIQQQDQFVDSGIYVMAIAHVRSRSQPIFFLHEYMDNFRNIFAYYILLGEISI